MQSSKKISLIIKVLIILLTFGFLYKKVFSNEDFSGMKLWFLSILETKNPWKFIVVIFLMLFNWFVEAIKWKYLINKLESVSLWLSIKAIFLGITVSIFTPNRVGEFGGRVFCLEKADRIKSVLLTVIGNVSQLVVTIVFGLLALCYYTFQYESLPFPFLNQYKFLLISFVFLVIGFVLFMYLNTSFLTFLLRKIPYVKRYQDYIKVFSYFSFNELLNIFYFSFFRYVIFSFQFYLLMCFFDVEITFLQSVTMSSLTFLSMSIIPTIALTEIGVRGSVAVFFFGLLSDNLLGITTAAFSLWAINLVLPAIIGVFFVYNLKFFRS